MVKITRQDGRHQKIIRRRKSTKDTQHNGKDYKTRLTIPKDNQETYVDEGHTTQWERLQDKIDDTKR